MLSCFCRWGRGHVLDQLMHCFCAKIAAVADGLCIGEIKSVGYVVELLGAFDIIGLAKLDATNNPCSVISFFNTW